LILQLNRGCRHAGFNQKSPVDFAITLAADQDAWRGVLLEQFRRAFRPVTRTAAQNDQDIGVYRPTVHTKKILRKNKSGDAQQQDEREKQEANPQKPFSHANHLD
jgi:hypothetical protein